MESIYDSKIEPVPLCGTVYNEEDAKVATFRVISSITDENDESFGLADVSALAMALRACLELGVSLGDISPKEAREFLLANFNEIIVSGAN
ncbi:hypothetical protein [Kordiimonas sp. SCSIO 12610]|uniref:hypothetical protein n=1 Tax=Kordiimonas sp. SCSIO 12610 TaxID=2829597 RepID=UPI002108FCF4|nr:hypothetical protein [Kordiimonas sp. SCSIO 12610]UTW53954.1 hypothetical protein KFF44_08880 [Kordiimonas sp. SCSIO 12610]